MNCVLKTFDVIQVLVLIKYKKNAQNNSKRNSIQYFNCLQKDFQDLTFFLHNKHSVICWEVLDISTDETEYGNNQPKKEINRGFSLQTNGNSEFKQTFWFLKLCVGGVKRNSKNQNLSFEKKFDWRDYKDKFHVLHWLMKGCCIKRIVYSNTKSRIFPSWLSLGWRLSSASHWTLGSNSQVHSLWNSFTDLFCSFDFYNLLLWISHSNDDNIFYECEMLVVIWLHRG
jgi:hypothetical protein